MSFLKFILSFFFAPIQESPVIGIPMIPAPIPAPTAPQVNLDKALLNSAEAEVEALKAEVKALKKANARLAIAVEDAQEDFNNCRDWVTRLQKEAEAKEFGVRLAENQAQGMCNLANNRAQEINELQDKLDAVEADLVMANNWLVQALFRANDESRRADTYKAILLSQAARKSSNFYVPAIASDLTEEELNWRRRMTALRFEATLAAYDYEVAAKPVAKKTAAKPADKRGHRNGHVPMSARELYYYLNR